MIQKSSVTYFQEMLIELFLEATEAYLKLHLEGRASKLNTNISKNNYKIFLRKKSVLLMFN